jgi:hypothetical protein
MTTWRNNGPLETLLAIINYIKTPQQYALFEKYQRLARGELPAKLTPRRRSANMNDLLQESSHYRSDD